MLYESDFLEPIYESTVNLLLTNVCIMFIMFSRFTGNGFLALDKNNYRRMDDEMSIKLKLKPERPDGLILLLGDENQGNFVALEIRSQYLIYR